VDRAEHRSGWGNQNQIMSERSAVCFRREASLSGSPLTREAQDEAGRGRFLLVLFFHVKEKYNKT